MFSSDPVKGTLFSTMLGYTAFFAAAFSLSLLLIVKVSGPLMTNVTSTLRDVILSFAACLLFPDVSCTWELMVGMSVGFVGAFYHIYDKF